MLLMRQLRCLMRRLIKSMWLYIYLKKKKRETLKRMRQRNCLIKSIRLHKYLKRHSCIDIRCAPTNVGYVSIRQNTSAYVSIRQ